MKPDTGPGYSAHRRELDALHAAYGNADFTRSILRVFAIDCPAALTQLTETIARTDVTAARNTVHSIDNILGVVAPLASRPVVDAISADLKEGRLEAAAGHTRELGMLIGTLLEDIQAWLDEHPGEAGPDAGVSGDEA